MSTGSDGGVRQVAHPSADDLDRARAVVGHTLAPTPLVALELPGADTLVLAKLDSLQPTGSFKVRGALSALSAYSAHGKRIIAASAGNHGLGVVFAAARLGVRATVVVPETASAAKVDALRRLGADLIQHGRGYEAAEEHALALAAEDPDTVFVSAYNDPYVIDGQATWVAEVAPLLPDESTLVVPVGGGGLISGTALAVADLRRARVVGVEAAESRAFSAAVTAGHVVQVPVGDTLADGLAGGLEPGSITPHIAGPLVHSFTAVTEAEIARAIRFLALECGLVVEGSGAVGIAALMAGRVPVTGQPVVLITGRNITRTALVEILS